MIIENFDDCDKWIFRAILYYGKCCPEKDRLAPFYHRKVCQYFNKLTYMRKQTYEPIKNS